MSGATDRPAGLPRRLGPYVIEGYIGQGAASSMLRGRLAQGGASFAIKVLRLAASDHDQVEELRQRFARESLAVQRLSHRGIVRFVGAGEDDGVAWVAMELASGHDLARHVSPDTRLSPGRVLDIGAQLAEALSHAHRHGIVHRDLKPMNVIYDPASGVVKLTDFGIARLADASRTRTGLVLGTPAYMPPEQIAGLPVDGRADLYALGVLLFELLCARLPFEAPTLGELMQRIAREPAPDLRVLRPELPDALAALVAQALAKRPGERPPDGDAMARALRAIAGEA